MAPQNGCGGWAGLLAQLLFGATESPRTVRHDRPDWEGSLTRVVMGHMAVYSLTPGPGSAKLDTGQYSYPCGKGRLWAAREENEGGSKSMWEGVVTQARVGALGRTGQQ